MRANISISRHLFLSFWFSTTSLSMYPDSVESHISANFVPRLHRSCWPCKRLAPSQVDNLLCPALCSMRSHFVSSPSPKAGFLRTLARVLINIFWTFSPCYCSLLEQPTTCSANSLQSYRPCTVTLLNQYSSLYTTCLKCRASSHFSQDTNAAPENPLWNVSMANANMEARGKCKGLPKRV